MTAAPRADESVGSWFPGAHVRDRVAAIVLAMRGGCHEDGPAEGTFYGLDDEALVASQFSKLEWQLTTAVHVTTVRDGRRFGAIVQPVTGEWAVLGLSSPEPDATVAGAERMDAVLGNHAHQSLGVHRDFGRALQIAETFVLTASAPSDRCACDSVDTDAAREVTERAGEPKHVQPNPVLGRVVAALESQGIAASDIHLTTSPHGRISGYVVATRFAHASHSARQLWLGVLLDRTLGPDSARQNVGGVSLLTPAEAE